MRPVSEAFLRTVRGSHRMVVEARAVAPGLTGTNPSGTVLAVLGGDVQVDGSASVRSTLDLTVDGTNLWPTSAASPLAPYGNEVFVRRGIAFANGTTEWVSLGYFRIESPEQDAPPHGPIRINASDRMAGVIEASLVAPKAYAPTATLGAVLSALVTEVYPWAVIEWDDATSARTLGRAVVVEEDRFRFLDDLVTSAGKVWYWDHRGILVIKSPPSPAAPVFDVNHGEGGVLVSMSRRLSREGVFNGVIAEGEGADNTAPARAVAIDNDPASPTYWHGAFGKIPTRFSSPLLTTGALAQTAASAILRRSLGAPYAVDFSAVPNPALEPFDPVRVTYGSSFRPQSAATELHILDRLTIPLTATAAMTASTREQRAGAIGFL